MVSPRDLRIGLTWKFSSGERRIEDIEVMPSSFKEKYVWAQNSILSQIINQVWRSNKNTFSDIQECLHTRSSPKQWLKNVKQGNSLNVKNKGSQRRYRSKDDDN